MPEELYAHIRACLIVPLFAATLGCYAAFEYTGDVFFIGWIYLYAVCTVCFSISTIIIMVREKKTCKKMPRCDAGIDPYEIE